MSPSDGTTTGTRAGTRFGDCEVLFELASGGMATVFLARQSGDAGFERLVALKRVHPHLVRDPEIFAMVSDEARIAGLLRHPNVVPVTGVYDARGELVLIQEFVEGFGLGSLLKKLRARGDDLDPRIASAVVVDALHGLHAAHEAKDLRGDSLGIVHRDVSPQNLLVGTDGVTRLIDFGIARAERRMAFTRTGVLKGKLVYMAPEQVEEAPVDRRADVFAAGVVLYEAIAGERPFTGQDDAAVMARILLGGPDLSRVEERAPALAPVLRRALEKRPQDRPATALELAKAIARAIPPADREEVAALVRSSFQTEIDALHARIADGLAEGDDLQDRDVADSAPPKPLASAKEHGLPDAPARGRRRWRWIATASVVLIGAAWAAWAAGSRPMPASPPPQAQTGAASSRAPVTSAISRTVSAPSAATPAPSPISTEPSASASRPAAASNPSRGPRVKPSATASSRPELHPSPYRSGP